MERSLIADRTAGKSGFRSISWRNVFLVLCALAALVAPTAAHATQKNVLILSGGRGRVSIDQMEASLRSHFVGPVNFSVVDLENPRFEQKAYQDNLAEALRAGYASEKLDLVVAVMAPSLQFAVRYHAKVFPGVPVVFMSVVNHLPEKMWPGVTGVVSTPGIAETIDLALRLEPDTKAVAIITQGVQIDEDWLLDEHRELLSRRDKVEEIDLIGPATPDLIQRVAALPAHTVVLFQLYPADANQPAFGVFDVLAAVTLRLPTYSISPALVLERGGIGGASYDPATDADLAGQLAARVLAGERADDIPVVHNSKPELFVNWRQLHRWNIPESALPPGVHIVDREPTLWERGRKYFLIGIAVIVLQALLIVALFWHRARRRKAEVELGKSEQKFSKSFRQSPLAISIASTKDDCYLEVNETFEELTGWTRDEVAGRSQSEIELWVDHDRRSAFLKQLLVQGNARDLEIRIRRKDGQVRTTLGSAELIEVDGEKCCLSVWTDITERKQAEEALASMSHKLIEAQEKERTRIARELHDDINQRIALLAIELTKLRLNNSSLDSEARGRMKNLEKQVSDLGKEVHAISHRLHSSKLELLGVVTACRSFCREVAEVNNVTVDFSEVSTPQVAQDVSLCLFRILQESLNNAIKHSGAQHFEVRLRGVSDEIQLTVRDCGVGFDAQAALRGNGIGLISMRERASLVKGTILIASKPMAGTEITLRVPIAANSQSQAISETGSVRIPSS
jgi:PAS domain S-box-containing protein